jgi:hypothetical protein
MTLPPSPASAAAPAESGDIDCWAAIGTSDSPTPQKKQGKSGGRAPKAKGSRFERAIVKLLQDAGLGAERVPLSGSAGGSYSGDLTVPILGRDLVVEVKARANGFSRLYSWLENRDVLVVRADRHTPLVILPFCSGTGRSPGCPWGSLHGPRREP